MSDDDVAALRALIQNFRSSMAQAMDDLDSRVDGLAREVRAYNLATTSAAQAAATTTTNEMASLVARWDRRYRQVEDRLADLERQL